MKGVHSQTNAELLAETQLILLRRAEMEPDGTLNRVGSSECPSMTIQVSIVQRGEKRRE
jgi:hypothetical protein